MKCEFDVRMKIRIVKLVLFIELRDERNFLSKDFEIWNTQTSNGIPHSNALNLSIHRFQFRFELLPICLVLGFSVRRIPVILIGLIDLRNPVHSRLIDQSKLRNESGNRTRGISTAGPPKKVDFIMRNPVVVVCKKSIPRLDIVFQTNSERTFKSLKWRYIFAFGSHGRINGEALKRIEG